MSYINKVTRGGRTKKNTVICDSIGSVRIPNFDNIAISTKTVIGVTNLIIDIEKFHKYFPYADYVVVKKKRGRRKKNFFENPNSHIPAGSFITLKCKLDIRGVNLKAKKQSKTYFLHSETTVAQLEDKAINVKVSRNGKLQMTGCQNNTHHIDYVKYLYQHMLDIEECTGETLFAFNDGRPVENKEIKSIEPFLPRREDQELCVIFREVMKNIDFSIGFQIRRNPLSYFINRKTKYVAIYESSMGPSVNIKLPIKQNRHKLLNRMRIFNEQIIHDTIPYQDYFDMLTTKEQMDDLATEDYHTFLVFATGSIIMSSQGPDMVKTFYEFIDILIKNRKYFEEIDEFHSKPKFIHAIDDKEEIKKSVIDVSIITKLKPHADINPLQEILKKNSGWLLNN